MLNKYLLNDFIILFIYIQEYQQLVSVSTCMSQTPCGCQVLCGHWRDKGECCPLEQLLVWLSTKTGRHPVTILCGMQSGNEVPSFCLSVKTERI